MFVLGSVCEIPSSKLTWQQKVDLLKMFLLLKMGGISIAMLVHQRVTISKKNLKSAEVLGPVLSKGRGIDPGRKAVSVRGSKN